jgi:hypothetical protein
MVGKEIDYSKFIRPNENCRHCYGRGTIGKNIKTGEMIICSCVIKKYRAVMKGKVTVDVGKLR